MILIRESQSFINYELNSKHVVFLYFKINKIKAWTSHGPCIKQVEIK